MASRIVIVAVIAAMVLVLGPLSVPGWARITFVVFLLFTIPSTSVNRMQQESRLALALWQALIGRPRSSGRS